MSQLHLFAFENCFSKMLLSQFTSTSDITGTTKKKKKKMGKNRERIITDTSTRMEVSITNKMETT